MIACKLGMCEMEMAAERIVQLQERRHPPFFSTMYISDFPSEQEQKGFLELLHAGYLGKQSGFTEDGKLPEGFNAYTYNGSFVPTVEFWSMIKGLEAV